MLHFLIFPSSFFPFTNDRSRRVCEVYKAKSVVEICSSRQMLGSRFFQKLFLYLLPLFSVRLDLNPDLLIPDPAHVSHRFQCVVTIDRDPDVWSLGPSGAPTSSSSSSLPPPASSDPSTFSTVWVSSAAAPQTLHLSCWVSLQYST